MMNKWDLRFLEIAEHIAQWSKDPSTKCGAVITKEKRIVSCGFNGFPAGVGDTPARLNDRQYKYQLIIHAEVNALAFANEPLAGATIYVWPMPPCVRCATQIIQADIKRIVAPEPSPEHVERWGDDIELAMGMYAECGVVCEMVEEKR